MAKPQPSTNKYTDWPIEAIVPFALNEAGATDKTRTAIRTADLAEFLVSNGRRGTVVELGVELGVLARRPDMRRFTNYVGGDAERPWNNHEWFNAGE